MSIKRESKVLNVYALGKESVIRDIKNLLKNYKPKDPRKDMLSTDDQILYNIHKYVENHK